MKLKILFGCSLLLLTYACSNHPEKKHHYRRKIHFKEFTFTTPDGLGFFVTQNSLKGIISDGYIRGDTLDGGKIRLDISTMFMTPPDYSETVILKSVTIGSLKKKLVVYKLPGDLNNVEIDAWDTTLTDVFRPHTNSFYNIVMGGRKIRSDQMEKIIELFNSLKSASVREKSGSTKKSEPVGI